MMFARCLGFERHNQKEKKPNSSNTGVVLPQSEVAGGDAGKLFKLLQNAWQNSPESECGELLEIGESRW